MLNRMCYSEQKNTSMESSFNRRQFVKYVSSSALVLASGGAYYWLNKPYIGSEMAIDNMLDELESLRKKTLRKSGWDAARTFHHLAQSIEFSMTGFPETKSKLFQKTVGKVAFKFFNARGEMYHGLQDAIPGEVIHLSGEAAIGLNRLKLALKDFKNYSSDLKPHFAYGELNHADYSIAHVLHIKDHLQEFELL